MKTKYPRARIRLSIGGYILLGASSFLGVFFYFKLLERGKNCLNGLPVQTPLPEEFGARYLDEARLLPCRDEKEAAWSAGCYINDTVTIVLSVWKRNTLARQLDEAAAQSLAPTQILVVQSKDFVDSRGIISNWSAAHPGVDVQLIHFSGNSGYHGRFHVAYLLSNTEYVSVWDDDVITGPDFVREAIRQSRENGDALMGTMGRCITALPHESNGSQQVQQEPCLGQNDFVGHSWTLKRDHLRYYFAMRPFTYQTGEDIQLAFALQKNGIPAYLVHQGGKATMVDDKQLRTDENASFKRKDKNLVRNLLLCQVIQAGFDTLSCENCTPEAAEACVRALEPKVDQFIWNPEEDVE